MCARSELKRYVTQEGGAVEPADVGELHHFAAGPVVGAAVIPHHEIPRLPFVMVDELRVLLVCQQLIQQSRTLLLIPIGNPDSEAQRHEQNLVAGYRMGAHDGMLDVGGEGSQFIGVRVPVSEIRGRQSGVGPLIELMDRLEPSIRFLVSSGKVS